MVSLVTAAVETPCLLGTWVEAWLLSFSYSPSSPWLHSAYSVVSNCKSHCKAFNSVRHTVTPSEQYLIRAKQDRLLQVLKGVSPVRYNFEYLCEFNLLKYFNKINLIKPESLYLSEDKLGMLFCSVVHLAPCKSHCSCTGLHRQECDFLEAGTGSWIGNVWCLSF